MKYGINCIMSNRLQDKSLSSFTPGSPTVCPQRNESLGKLCLLKLLWNLSSSLHFLKSPASVTWGCYHLLAVFLPPHYPGSLLLPSPHGSQHELFTGWQQSCPDAPHQKLTCPFSGSATFPESGHPNLLHRLLGLSLCSSFFHLSGLIPHKLFFSFKTSALNVICLGTSSLISLV